MKSLTFTRNTVCNDNVGVSTEGIAMDRAKLTPLIVGELVRISPNEISVTAPAVIQTIYGHTSKPWLKVRSIRATFCLTFEWTNSWSGRVVQDMVGAKSTPCILCRNQSSEASRSSASSLQGVYNDLCASNGAVSLSLLKTNMA